MASGSGIVSWIITAVLDWLWNGFQRIAKDMKKKAEDEAENSEIRKGIENAKTDEELQKELDRAGRKLGRRP
jgi:hypothetical protein